MLSKKVGLFIKKVEKKFGKYFVGFGVKKQKKGQLVNVIIDDRDVRIMKKEEVYKKTCTIKENMLGNVKPNMKILHPALKSDR